MRYTEYLDNQCGLRHTFGVESDEEKEIVGIVYNYPRSTDWPKEKTDDLLKDIDIPESLLAYAEEIDISRRQLGVSLEG